MRKKTAGILVLLAGAYAVCAQGTVSLANYLNLTPYIYVSLVPFIRGGPGNAVPLGGSVQGSPAPTMTDYAQEAHYGADWTVALYGAPGNNQPESALVELTTGLGAGPFATATFANGVNDMVAGTWNTAVFGTIAGATGNGSAASIQLAGWYNDGGFITSLSQAQSLNVPWGFSVIANTVTGGPNPSGPDAVATSLPSSLGDFALFGPDVIPEPNTIALAAVGASAFVMRMRRKK